MLSVLAFTTLALQFLFASSLSVRHSAGCHVTDAISKMHLPSTFPVPKTELSYVAIAIGSQNYTCASDGASYTNVGAVAELFDISCLASNGAVFDTIADAAITLWKHAPPNLTPQKVISLLDFVKSSVILGEHYYVPNPNTGVGVNPKWDFTTSGATAGNNDAYVVSARSFGGPAPSGKQDIDWVYLTNIAGKLADEVYRTDTKLGQPPSGTCLPGSSTTVKYAAKYWLFGGSVHKN